MDILRTFPVRSSLDNGDDNNEFISKKKKRATLEIEEEDEEEESPKRAKHDLGLNIQEDFFEVPEIKKKRLPREDGEQWGFWEQTPIEEAKRPYGKTYLEDQAERQKILSRNKDYRFASELAGALRKELSDIVEPEDMERLRQEQQFERAQNDVELKRTRIDMDKKYELVQKLKVLEKEENEKLKGRRSLQAPYMLRARSKYLVDNDTLPGITTTNKYYGFLGLVSLYDTYVKFSKEERDKLADEELPGDSRQQSEIWLDLFFYLYVFYRDFLNNESDYSLKEALTVKLSYLDDSPLLIKQEDDIKQPDQLKYSPLVLEVEQFFNTSSKNKRLDWSLYKKRQTETINMTFFDELGISKEKEAEMAKLGGQKRYGKSNPVYLQRALMYLYGSTEERSNATKGKFSGLSLLSDDTLLGGHPADMNTLIQIQFPAYKEEGTDRMPEIELLMRSHFLWLFFDEVEWVEKTTLLVSLATSLINAIIRITRPLHDFIEEALVLYKHALFRYLKEVASILTKEVDGQPTISLSPTQARLLFEGSDAQFDELNRLFSGINIDDIIEDKLFQEYLYKGAGAFISQQYRSDLMDVERRSTSPPPKIIVNKQYPVLLLHSLFRAYEDYLKEYINASTNNIAGIKSAINKATKKIADVVGDESYSLQKKSTDYRQRKAFTTRPENSGFIKMKPEISHLLRKAFLFVNDYAVSLRGLPLEGYQTDSAYETGLSTDFITLVAVMSADLELMFPDGYRSQKYFTKVKQEKQAIMARLRRYTWEGGSYGRPYVVRRDISMVPCFARSHQQQQPNNYIMF